MAERNFAFVVLGGESEDPAALEATLRDAVCTPLAMTDADLERARRRILGQYVRSFESVRGLAFAHAEQELEGIAPFGLRERLAGITRQEVEARQAELFAPERLAVAVVEP
jgi:predicted Zn-dependent peptidase